ncbi:helix-turn-helix transcriptional regulator [Paraburkholderia sp. UCT31]|uniref:helix-turn-helix domain-containing protein n=1 Tax=Paraburkholderia sp. UCT31 TaxID=2615209 RepID=UPI00165547A4|nr:helix-turn-helix transcriptional regulator [Paraburkholderia sp. UCT31]MBC8742911.1 helix-turn-helix transcriptional regulator [Paraburkholderia sp. UCT31]
MNRRTQSMGHLERTAGNDRLRRALAARLDRALKRAGISSARAANWLGVSEHDVQYWRRGITVPPLKACMRLATVLHLDVDWLCTGQSQAA